MVDLTEKMVHFIFAGQNMVNDITLLKSISLFDGLTDEQILHFVDHIKGKLVCTNKNDFILNSATNDDKLAGILVSGSALVVQDNIWGDRLILDYIQPSACFGEVFSIQQEYNPFSVIAKEDSVAFIFEANRILKPCSPNCPHYDYLVTNFIKVIIQKSHRLIDKVTHSCQRSTRAKILAFLSTYAEEKGSLSFDIPFNRQELADYLGVDRAAMSVVLSELKEEGYINYNKNSFVIIKKSTPPPLNTKIEA